jgi:hypothetical protein
MESPRGYPGIGVTKVITVEVPPERVWAAEEISELLDK